VGRVTNAQADARRAKVAELWIRGVSLSGIAASVGCDWETVKRDTAVLASRAAKELNVERELARLLLAGRAVESAAWARSQLAVVMSAQRQQLAVLEAWQSLDLAQRVADLEAQIARVAPAAALPVARLNGRGRGWP
jgi:hypothetical protein